MPWFNSTTDADKDLFVSYARVDNRDGWVERFVRALAEEHRRVTGREMAYFFDKEDIRNFGHWESAIFHEGIARAKLFLAFLSPSYLASEVCRREWRRWIEHEISKHILTNGAAPIYVVEVPALFGKPMPHEHEVARQVAELCRLPAPHDQFTADVAPIVREMRRRQIEEVRPFYDQGVAALQREDLRRQLSRLAADVGNRVELVRRAALSESTVPAYNRHFTGRLDELVRLRDLLRDNQAGVIAGVHGLGGIGKTELAYTYAHAYASAYPGGRFYLECERQTDLRQAALRLGDVAAFREQISDEERKTPDALFAAVVRVLNGRIERLGHVLLVLDNVTDANLLTAQQTDCLTVLGGKLHLLATTRLASFTGRHCLTLGELPGADALALLEKYRPFADDAERAAAEEIVARLGGFALAVELVAARLAVKKTATYAGVLKDLGLEKLDAYAEDKQVELRRHNHEKRLERVLGPTLADLPAEGRRALEYAALLPPDRVALPWLRELVTADYPALGEPRPDGEDLWEELVESLVRLALFTRIEEETTARGQVRVHRLVQGLVRRRWAEEVRPRLFAWLDLLQRCVRRFSFGEQHPRHQERIDELIRRRGAVLDKTTRWQEARWELEPLILLR